MLEQIKNRPLSQYYLWRVCQKNEKEYSKEGELVTTKQVIGQLRAERKNLEKLSAKSISLHISSLAFLEEMLKNMSEESFNILRKELLECYYASNSE